MRLIISNSFADILLRISITLFKPKYYLKEVVKKNFENSFLKKKYLLFVSNSQILFQSLINFQLLNIKM